MDARAAERAGGRRPAESAPPGRAASRRDWQAILATAAAKGLSGKALAEQIGVTGAAVSYQARRHQIRLRHGCSKYNWPIIFEQALAEQLPARMIADRLGIIAPIVHQAAKRYGYRLYSATTARRRAWPEKAASGEA